LQLAPLPKQLLSIQPSSLPNDCCFCQFFDKNILFIVEDAITACSIGVIAKATNVYNCHCHQLIVVFSTKYCLLHHHFAANITATAV